MVTEARLDYRTGIELRRVMLRWQAQKMREAARNGGRPYRQGSGGTRGRDGPTVFGVDGRKLGPAMIEWAFRLGATKAHLAQGRQQATVIGGAGRRWLRAWSEIEVDPHAPPDPAHEVETHDPGDDEWDEHHAHLQAVEARETPIHAAIDEHTAHMDLTRRRAAARERNRLRRR